jgi:hypothetical protein
MDGGPSVSSRLCSCQLTWMWQPSPDGACCDRHAPGSLIWSAPVFYIQRPLAAGRTCWIFRSTRVSSRTTLASTAWVAKAWNSGPRTAGEAPWTRTSAIASGLSAGVGCVRAGRPWQAHPILISASGHTGASPPRFVGWPAAPIAAPDRDLDPGLRARPAPGPACYPPTVPDQKDAPMLK